MCLAVFSEGEDVVMVMRTVMNGACDYMVKPMTSEAIKFIWKHVLRWRLSALPANASSSLQPSDHLAAALAAVAPPPPPAVQLPAAPAQARNRDGEAHEEAELSTQPPALVPSGVQEAAAAVWSSRGDGQEAPPAAVAAAAKAPSKKRGASEVSDRGSNNLEATTGRKKVRTRFTWTTVSHTSFVRAYEQLKDQEGETPWIKLTTSPYIHTPSQKKKLNYGFESKHTLCLDSNLGLGFFFKDGGSIN